MSQLEPAPENIEQIDEVVARDDAEQSAEDKKNAPYAPDPDADGHAHESGGSPQERGRETPG